MTRDNINPPFANGYWVWDDTINGLAFISNVKEVSTGVPALAAPTNWRKAPGQLRFKDTIDMLGMAQFRRQFQRRIKPNEPQIVTIQDIKDVAIFSVERQDLTPEFVSFLHTKRMDEFLRTLIVYFQYYLCVWDLLIARREEASRKLRQPMCLIIENKIRDDLADLRSMVARNYGFIILGGEDTERFYHMRGHNVSLSDKDRHLHEGLLSITAKIVWIALLRRNFTVIETELNRLLRSAIFNLIARQKETVFHPNNDENNVLLGKAYKVEKKLKHRSPTIQELVFDNHDYEMLAVGYLRVEPMSERTAYLEAAYTAPEELLFDISVGVGILGLSKEYLNPILKPKEGMGKRIQIPVFAIPDPIGKRLPLGESLPATPAKYQETQQTREARSHQCKMWRIYAAGLAMKTEDSVLESASASYNLSQDSEIEE